MRFLALLLLASALGAADMRQLGPNEDLPYCRVTLRGSDNGREVLTNHDGWYCAQTHMLYPAQDRALADEVQPFAADSVAQVTPAAVSPGRMPAHWRQRLNAYIAKNRPQVPDTDKLAAKPAK